MAPSTPTLDAPHGRTKQNVSRQLIAEVLRGEVASPWLVEVELAKRFGVSRTPIREAIAELVRLGLAERFPNRGAQLLPLGPTQLRELYSVRAVLEAEAARLAAAGVDHRELSRLLAEMQAMAHQSTRNPRWADREMEQDRRLHELVSSGANNRRLAMELSRYYELVEAVRDMLGRRYASQERALVEHIKLAGALLDRDEDAAARLMRQHIHAAGEAVIEAIF